MTDRQYARKREGLSWHPVAFHTRGLHDWKTVCGHPAVDPVVEVIPWGDPSCESGLRILNRRDEQAAQRGKPNTGEEFEREPNGSDV